MTKDIFPSKLYESAAKYARDYMENLQKAVGGISPEEIDNAMNSIHGAIERNSTIYICGNGGSSAIANHVTCDYIKLLGLAYNKPVKVISLNSTSELNFAIANDINFDDVFSFTVKQWARKGDVLWTVSSSGNSPNIVNALQAAKSLDMETIAFCGFSGGKSKEIADYPVYVPANNYGVVEDAHQLLTHVICQHLKSRQLPSEQVGNVVF